jgi:hypothetical protein
VTELDHAWLDRINAAADIYTLVIFVIDLVALIRSQSSRSISLYAQTQYLIYCLWYGFYLWNFGQWLSVAIAGVWVCAYLVKIGVVIYFRMPSKASRA